jgi:beta-lactamase regulating signal transducer with metallopeptidase domain
MTAPLLLAADAAAKCALALALAAFTALLMHRASAAARHLVWTIGLAGVIAISLLTPVLPHWKLPIVRVTAAGDVDISPLDTTPREHGRVAPMLADRHAEQRPVTPASPSGSLRSAISTRVSALSLLVLVWAAGAMLLLARLAVSIAAVQVMLRRTQAAADAPWLGEARALAVRMRVRNIRFRCAPAGSMPMACGLIRATILMPQDADAWPSERLRIVLLHELAHIRRRDCLTHAMAQIACATHWFNPLAWLAARRLRIERERACDDLVLASGTRGSDYADQLIAIARAMCAARFPAIFAGATLAMAHRSQLEGRLMSILDPRVPRLAPSRARTTVAVTFASICIVTVAAVQPWAEAPQQEPQAVASTPAPAPPAAPVKPVAPAGEPVVPAHERHVQGGISGGIAGGIATGVAGGVAGGVATGISRGIAEGIAGGVMASVAAGVDEAARAVAQQVAVEHTARGRRREEGAADPRAVAALIEALKDSDKEVRETALTALASSHDPRAFEPLAAALKDANADIREAAAFGLGQLHDRRAVDPLLSMLKDESPKVREQAAFSLGELRDARAIDGLAAALKDENVAVRRQAAFALGQIR